MTSVCFFVRLTLSETLSTSSAFVMHPALLLENVIAQHPVRTKGASLSLANQTVKYLHKFVGGHLITK